MCKATDQSKMILIKLRLGVFPALIVSLISSGLRAQDLNMELIYGGTSDAGKILTEYLRPYANIIGSDLNAGWYNTARPHQTGGLDVTFSASLAYAPPSALSYDPSMLELNGELDLSQATSAPTIAGSAANRPSLSYSETVDLPDGSSSEVTFASYTLPDGTGLDYLPLPMAQFSIGIALGTDISVRFIPKVGYRDAGEIAVWGVGGRHSISQWIPGLKELEFLDISAQGGYTNVNTAIRVMVEPQDLVEVDPEPSYNWDDQRVRMRVEGWTANLIVSQTLPVISFYQGIGFASSLASVLMEGHYPIPLVILDPADPNYGKVSYEIAETPLEMGFENINNLRLNAGFRIALGVLTLHYDYTRTLYSTHTAGIGISFR